MNVDNEIRATTAAINPLPTAGAVLEIRDLAKRYHSTEVLGGVSFTVQRGELFGLLGTNGAGKTTTVEIAQGLRTPTSGAVRVLGLDPTAAGDAVRRRIGSQLQDAALPDRMRVGEALRLFAALHPSPRPHRELVDEWQLGALLRRPFGALSGGERQRLFVALALVGQPELVFLDELTQNLDPVSRRRTWDVVRRIRDGGTTVVLVTHDVEEAEQLCDRIVVLDYIAGYIGVVLAALGLGTLPAHIASNRELGVTRRYRASGISAGMLVATNLVVGIVLGLLSTAVVLVVGNLIYGIGWPINTWAVIAWYVAGLLCYIAIGGALGLLAPTARAANAIGNLLFLPTLLLGGGGPPRDVMSPAMSTVADLIPLSHITAGMRQEWLGATDSHILAWWPLTVAVAAVAASVWVARRRAV